jgi:hypothetical protein
VSSPYVLQLPTSWAAVPERYSFSSLSSISACPRRWQFLRSAWGQFDRFPQRQHPKAIEGQIVHEAIERLMRGLGSKGMPSIGSPAFAEALAETGFWAFFDARLRACNSELAGHPRTGPAFVIRSNARDLANRAIRLVRERYRPLDTGVRPARTPAGRVPDAMRILEQAGILSEYRISHPMLPLDGIVDLVEQVDGDVRIVDFKTGERKPAHEEQGMLYAMLWWRSTGVMPRAVVLQYLDDRHEFEVSEVQLIAAESRAAAEIEEARRALGRRPAEARPGDSCRFCPVRARCDEGWSLLERDQATGASSAADLELKVAAAPSASGFIGLRLNVEVSVVYDEAIGLGLPAMAAGVRVRIIDAVPVDNGAVCHVRAWTEIYVLSPNDTHSKLVGRA